MRPSCKTHDQSEGVRCISSVWAGLHSLRQDEATLLRFATAVEASHEFVFLGLTVWTSLPTVLAIISNTRFESTRITKSLQPTYVPFRSTINSATGIGISTSSHQFFAMFSALYVDTHFRQLATNQLLDDAWSKQSIGIIRPLTPSYKHYRSCHAPCSATLQVSLWKADPYGVVHLAGLSRSGNPE